MTENALRILENTLHDAPAQALLATYAALTHRIHASEDKIEVASIRASRAHVEREILRRMHGSSDRLFHALDQFVPALSEAPPRGATAVCRGCGLNIAWNGTRWVDDQGQADMAGFCAASTDPDPTHEPQS